MKYIMTVILFGFIAVLMINAQNQETYLFSYFTGNGEDGLHLAYSQDGYTFKALKDGKSYLSPTVSGKLMRDPSITRGPDGTFHLVWTTGWREKVIGYASSSDLVHWSDQKTIPVMTHEKNAKNSWAPEVFYDGENERFVIIWSTTISGKFTETDKSSDNGLNHRMYIITTKDFETFSDTKLFYDGGFNVIDGYIAKSDSQYILFLKDETTLPEAKKNIRIAYAKTAAGPYGQASKPFTISWVEGPSAIKIGEDWFVYYDEYRNKRYGAMKSNNLEQWEDISDKISFPKGSRHGSVFAVAGLKINKDAPGGFELDEFVQINSNQNMDYRSRSPMTLSQTRQLLNVKITSDTPYHLTVTTARGQTVLTKQGKHSQLFSIPKKALAKGLYIIGLQLNHQTHFLKATLFN